MKIFIGNLSFDAKEPDVKRVFEGFGILLGGVGCLHKIRCSNKGVRTEGLGPNGWAAVNEGQG